MQEIHNDTRTFLDFNIFEGSIIVNNKWIVNLERF